ncbi:cytochrome P450 [Spongiactinospora gelatinilytica]|uniref:Cytochrome P450 n=1 Tax=Spongiactinospora gelatinilytica TaxID=2666298 RepID=A0A2W2F723_9ACTN|nr:cytochrome P450 [Spongiactinospora gelatinilytica]PZG31243.1 cytochrome P450 [Spongiactinospora gelatinilytica]
MSQTITTTFPLAALADPYPFYRELRQAGRLHHVVIPYGRAALFVTGHADACTVLNDPGFSKAHKQSEKRAGGGEGESAFADNMVGTDPPEHTRLRRLAQAAFTRRKMENLRSRIAFHTGNLLDAMERAGRADIMADLALPLSTRMISDLLGLSPADDGILHDHAAALRLDHAVMLEERPDPAAMVSRFRREQAVLGDYSRRVIAEKRETSGDDLVHDLIAARDGDNRLSERELVATVMLLITAGYITSANVIANGVHALLANPDQLDLLRRRPDLIQSAVEEFLRYEGSISVVEGHAATDIDLGGEVIPTGSLIFLPIHSVNRDPAVFQDPDRFDITRFPNPHLAFSRGVHYCLGAHLARMEAEVSVLALIERFPGLALDHDRPGELWMHHFFIRTLKTLPVRLG